MAGPSSTHRGWWRDIENARLVAVYDGSQEFAFNASALFPVTSNGSALGTTALMWSDLFLASGAVINFNAGDVALTHAASALHLSGADLFTADGYGVVVGHTAQVTVSDGGGVTDLVPELQVVGSAQADSTLLVATFATSDTVSPTLALAKSGAGTPGVVTTAVADNEYTGRILSFGADGTDMESPVAEIRFVINGTVGTGDMPGSIEFYTTTDGGETPALSFTVDTDQNIYIQNTNGIVVGHTAQLAGGTDGGGTTIITPEVQILGTSSDDTTILMAGFSNTATVDGAPSISMLKSGNSTIGSNTIVTDNEILAAFGFYGDDGVDYGTLAARYEVEVDDASPEAGGIGAAFVWYTMPGGGTSAAAERWRITAGGIFNSAGGTPSNAATVDGSVLATGGIAFTDVANAWIDDASHGSGTVAHLIGNETITTSSDVRLKVDIENTVVNATELFRRMRVVDYTWGENYVAHEAYNARGRWMGMIAQEVLDIAPWIINAPGDSKDCRECRAGLECEVHVNEDGSPQFMFVNYDYLVPTVVKGLQEIDDRVLRLEGFKEHTENGWLKEQFTELLETDEGFRALARGKLAV